MVAISSQGISNSSVCGDGRHLNVLRRCQPIIQRIEVDAEGLMKPFCPSYSDVKYRSVQNIITIIKATLQHCQVAFYN